MSTSTSTAPAPLLGECVVCGKESSTRCSSCAKGGVDWMFFCSGEHQKLIWSVHKRVCGGAFRWPALKTKERDEMIELSTKPYREDEGLTTWVAGLRALATQEDARYSSRVRMMGGEQKLFRIVIDTLVEKAEQSFVQDQETLHEYRAAAFSIKTLSEPFLEAITYTDRRRLAQLDPFGFVAYLERSHIPQITTPEYCDSSWCSEFQHRTTIFVSIINACQRSAEALDKNGLSNGHAYLMYALNKLSDLARGSVLSQAPSIAVDIMQVFLPKVLEEFEIMLSPEDDAKGLPWNECDNLLPGGITIQRGAKGDFRVDAQ